MRRSTLLIISSILLIFLIPGCGGPGIKEASYTDPEAHGFSTEKLQLLEKHLEESGSSAFMLVVDGVTIFEWGETERKHTIHSMRKALLNSLYGIAVSNEQIDTSATIRELEIDDEPGLTEAEKDTRIADMLRSRSGVYHHAAGVSQAMLEGMPERGSYRPGEHFYYNNWDFNTLGAILEQQTGESLYTLFHKQIAEPLGMKDYKGKYSSTDGESEDARIPDSDGFYQFETSKSRYPAYHFRMSARDLALYGQLYLDKGKWNGKQIVPEEWIEVSTKPYSIYSAEYGIAYGMLWYVLIPEGESTTYSFFHTGLGIHMLAVYPESNMVLVHRVDTENDYSYDNNSLHIMIDLIFDSKL